MTGNDALLKLLVVLNQLSIPYMLVGSYSSNIYGIPRMTMDADLVLQFDGDALSKLNKNLPKGLSFAEQSFFETVTATRKELLQIDGTRILTMSWPFLGCRPPSTLVTSSTGVPYTKPSHCSKKLVRKQTGVEC